MTETFDLRKTFNFFDKDGSGFISAEELKQALRACGRRPTETEFKQMLMGASVDPNKSLDYEQFASMMGSTESDHVSRVDIGQLFRAIDLDFSGYLTAAEVRHLMTKLHLSMDDAVVDEMVSMYDLDGNGQINLEEFIGLVKGLGFTVDEDVSEETNAGNTVEEPEVVEPQVMVSVADFPAEVRKALVVMDPAGTGEVSVKDMERAAELLKIEKMAGVHDPEANPSLHWEKGREKRGLGGLVYKVNHIALIVSDIGRSAAFYSDVMGFQQIRRPNFDRHGAWFTMGNVELHLIKGTPLVHGDDDLIVSHYSIETFDIDKVPGLLRKFNIPFRQNVSVPNKKDAGSGGTNKSNTSDNIVRQYFVRDPDGYYLEICNCDILTKYCLGEEKDIDGYEEGAKPLSLSNATKVITLMQKWTDVGAKGQEERESLIDEAKKTDMSWGALAKLLGCGAPATVVDDKALRNLTVRLSVYGDICQNETEASLKEILLACGNNIPKAQSVMKLRADVENIRVLHPPAFYDNGEKINVPKAFDMHDDL